VCFRVPADASMVAPQMGGLGSHTTGHRVPKKRRWQGTCLSYIVRGYMLEVVGPHSLPIPFYQDRQTDRQTVVRCRVEPRPSTLDFLRRSSPELCSPRYGTQLGGHCRNCSSAAWGNAEFCTSRLHRIPYYDYTGSMSGAVYVCPPSATVHKVLYYPDAWF
jgi:hypothetical protein